MARRKGRVAQERTASLTSFPGDPNGLRKTDSMCLNPYLLRTLLPKLPVPSASPWDTPLAWITLFRQNCCFTKPDSFLYFPFFDY